VGTTALLSGLLAASPIVADEVSAAAQANNPSANMTAFNLQNYYIGRLTESDNDAYSVPLGAGIGNVFKRGKTVFSVFIEPQASVADDCPGQPDWQILGGFNIQFMN
jgi:hypothetical protein